MFTHLAAWLDEGISWLSSLAPPDSFFQMGYNVRGLLAVIMVAWVCGSVGSMVVGNRMAFFSDALAHCAFAGVALGLLLALVRGIPVTDFKDWISLIMILFGISAGLGIAWVRERTSLASDTVIGVFFAGAIGLGAIFMRAVGGRGFNIENFLFGAPMEANSADLIKLACLVLVTLLFLIWMYNALVFTSFNPSLARSRRVPIRLCNYLFIALLGLIVNMCLEIVGALLINALLIVPAATAANLSGNMRQLFRWSILLSLAAGILGMILQWEIRIPESGAGGDIIQFGLSGIIVVLSVLMFFVSMVVGPWLRNRPARLANLSGERGIL